MTDYGLRPRDLTAELRWRRRLQRVAKIWLIAVGASVSFVILCLAVLWWLPAQPLIRGVIWQPTLAYPQPRGQWQQIGANTLLVQWLVSKNRAWRDHLGVQTWNAHTDWARLRRASWARHLVLGLAGDYDLAQARTDWRRLAKQSRRIVRHVTKPPQAWYASIEISPDWTNARAIRGYLQAMPRPLLVSVYRANGLSPTQFAEWVQSWLSDGIYVLFQDGVGTGHRSTPEDAVRYTLALIDVLGRQRVGIVVDAFRRTANGEFESASFAQLHAQLLAYRSLRVPIYVFSCRYLGVWQVLLLKLYAWLPGAADKVVHG